MVDRAGYIGSGQYFIKWWIGLGTFMGRDSTLSNGGPFLIRIFIVRKISILNERLVQIFNLMVRPRINGNTR